MAVWKTTYYGNISFLNCFAISFSFMIVDYKVNRIMHNGPNIQ